MCLFAVKSWFKLCITLHVVIRALAAKHDNCEIKELKQRTNCYFGTPLNRDVPVENGYLGTRNNSIYFIETSCSGELNYKQACAVEAAARANVHRKIYVLFAGFVKSLSIISWPLLDIIRNYANIEIFQLNVDDYLKGTPFEINHQKDLLREKLILFKYMPEILLFITLNKYGGIYVDFDTIIAKCLDDLPVHDNFVGKHDGFRLGTAVVALSKSIFGVAFTGKILRLLERMLPTETVTSIISRVCFGNDKINCDVLEIYDPEYFYPIREKDKEKYYSIKSNSSETVNPKTYAFHIWGAREIKNINIDSFYGFLMKKYCPVIFETFSSKQKTFEKRRKSIFNDTNSNSCHKIKTSHSKKTKHKPKLKSTNSTPASTTTEADTNTVHFVYLKDDEYGN